MVGSRAFYPKKTVIELSKRTIKNIVFVILGSIVFAVGLARGLGFLTSFVVVAEIIVTLILFRAFL